MYHDLFIMFLITATVSAGALVAMLVVGKKKRRNKLMRNFR